MAATPKVNLIINQGATFRYKFVWKDAKKRLIDLTGFTARMQMRPSVDSATVLATLTTENTGITLGATAGTVSIYLSAAATAGFNWATGVYDLELISPGGEIFRLVGGNIAVSPEVTR